MKVHPKANVHIHDPVLREAYSHNQTRVILMRNPFDDVWSWYKLEQTGLHAGRIKSRNFRQYHFADMQLIRQNSSGTLLKKNTSLIFVSIRARHLLSSLKI